MTLSFTPQGYRTLALAASLALPGLVQAQQAQKTAPAAALTAFARKGQAQGLKPTDVSSPVVTDSYTEANGVTHTYLQQRVNGLAVHNATGAVHTDASGKVVASYQSFVADAAQKAPSATPALTPEQAVTAATVALGLPRPVGLERVVEARPADGLVFNKGGISEENIPVRLLYENVDGKLVLTWGVTIASLDQQHYWFARVDAQSGRLVSKDDYTVSELATFRQHTTLAQGRRQQAFAFASAAAAPQQVASPQNITGPARSLTVVAMPGDNPLQTPRTSVPLSSVNRTYSPYGWQVAEGLAPANFFADSYSLLSSGKYLTRGNNVAAYDDYSPTITPSGNGNAASSTNSPDGGANLDFDFPFVQTNGPRDANNLAASVTNLFYWNNVNHDVMMAHGFDEAAGNFQYKNITGVAAGNDFVRAEAQDGSGRNNANFSTPNDGSSGRMQMYLFDNTGANTLTVTGASSVAGTYPFASVAFGPSLTKKPLAGQIVLVNDGVSDDNGAHGCASPFVNAAAVAGKIAFIQRGGCPQLTTLNPRSTNAFATKVKRAQANGATGVIVFDSLATTNLTNFGGTDTVGIRIPAIFISGANGFALRTAMLAGNTLNVSAALGPDIDGSFDSGVMTHEFGHGVSNRLTGGPNNSSCLNSASGNQTMGEGWSDFFGLWLTTRPGDIGSTPRYVGTYDNGNPIAVGPGFRRKPYTTNMTLNNYTYGQLSTGATPFQYVETHDVGEVWATVLWDLNWQFIYKYGYNADFYAKTGGNNVALKLVLDGCKTQRCNPGFLDGRDAILTADSVNNRGANASLIWAVFARRGMGYSAVQGPRTGAGGAPTSTGSVAAFDVPPTATPIVLSSSTALNNSSALEAYPNPAQGLLTVRTQLGSAAPIQVTVLDLLGKTVVAPTSVPVAKMQQSGVELNTSTLASGIYVVRVATTDGIYTTKVTIQH